jgi:nucleoside-diphosphate-sugar epimerase
MADSVHSRVLVTGAAGFLGSKVVEFLVRDGRFQVRALVRDKARMDRVVSGWNCDSSKLELFEGNLLSPKDCFAATEGIQIVYHLAAGTGTKSFPDAFRNSVITTDNLLSALAQHKCVKRFVNVSSFTVYRNFGKRVAGLLDETCPYEDRPHLRGEAYTYAKVKQDELVWDYAKRFGIPYVIIRPGVVYGPGKFGLFSGRVGTSVMGRFLHFGGGNTIPFTYRDNCAEAIFLAGIVPGVDGEVFNVVDDELPSSRKFLRMYKANVERVRSVYIPRPLLYFGCLLWEKYCKWSHDQMPPIYNRLTYNAFWKKTAYSNEKLKRMTGWKPTVPTDEGMKRFFQACRQRMNHA